MSLDRRDSSIQRSTAAIINATTSLLTQGRFQEARRILQKAIVVVRDSSRSNWTDRNRLVSLSHEAYRLAQSTNTFVDTRPAFGARQQLSSRLSFYQLKFDEDHEAFVKFVNTTRQQQFAVTAISIEEWPDFESQEQSMAEIEPLVLLHNYAVACYGEASQDPLNSSARGLYASAIRMLRLAYMGLSKLLFMSHRSPSIEQVYFCIIVLTSLINVSKKDHPSTSSAENSAMSRALTILCNMADVMGGLSKILGLAHVAAGAA